MDHSLDQKNNAKVMKMPLIKYNRLVDLMDKVKSAGYKDQITTEILHKFIAADFGITIESRRSIMKLLHEFDFIKELSIGVWQIVQKKPGPTPQEAWELYGPKTEVEKQKRKKKGDKKG